MQVIPQADGTLLVQGLSAETVYDMGNARVYTRCDATGRIVSAFLPEGVPLFTVRSVRYMVLAEGTVTDIRSAAGTARNLADQFKGTNSEGTQDKPKKTWTGEGAWSIEFDTARAVGRTWRLAGHGSDLAVTVTTFLDDGNPAVFQRVQITNNGVNTRVFALDVAISLQFERSYVAAGSRASGRVHAHMALAARFDGTLRPWQLVMDKTRSILSYALPVDPGQTEEFCLVTASGEDGKVDELLRNWRESYAQAEAYNAKLISLATNDDPLLQSLIVAGLNAGLSAYKKLDSGVAGFLAGLSYAYPPRVYFRDSYWTAQAALITDPELVRDNLLWLAQGIAPDGSCPSGVWDPGLFTPAELDTPGALNWIADHYDSPSFFVMLLHDYIAASGDLPILDEQVHGVSLFQQAVSCLEYLSQHDHDGDDLFEKPRAANDWADNVLRSGLVTYDLALFFRALTCLAWLAAQRRDLPLAQRYEVRAERVKKAINAHLWDEKRGYYRAYQHEGFVETHLSIDSLLTILYGIADDDQAVRSLDAAKRLLQTRRNAAQAYGDWGIMCCFPFYHEPADLFNISAEPYRYHNGADWPYWDGVYGLILLQRGDPDWRYVLTRWWQVALERGWLTPFEYSSPPHPRGGLLQGWSAMPAVALLHKKYVNWLNRESKPVR
ncbi:MAG TPA: trehalase family glycosidase [Aggregatilineaceae bacterium]|nr:trehalase family glycosidase [Aggregatilineaceae bacterium]